MVGHNLNSYVSHHHLWTWIRNMGLVLNASPAIHSQLETLAVVTLKCKICENGSAQLLHYQDFNSPCDKCLQKKSTTDYTSESEQ